ncbi:MAG: hypothetical protein KW793_00120 [Candidatus Doudnabacteria bacterium]|nr:hypothetical protein [Candidatus Doudnabacteria bacterium]
METRLHEGGDPQEKADQTVVFQQPIENHDFSKEYVKEKDKLIEYITSTEGLSDSEKEKLSGMSEEDLKREYEAAQAVSDIQRLRSPNDSEGLGTEKVNTVESLPKPARIEEPNQIEITPVSNRDSVNLVSLVEKYKPKHRKDDRDSVIQKKQEKDNLKLSRGNVISLEELRNRAQEALQGPQVDVEVFSPAAIKDVMVKKAREEEESYPEFTKIAAALWTKYQIKPIRGDAETSDQIKILNTIEGLLGSLPPAAIKQFKEVKHIKELKIDKVNEFLPQYGKLKINVSASEDELREFFANNLDVSAFDDQDPDQLKAESSGIESPVKETLKDTLMDSPLEDPNSENKIENKSEPTISTKEIERGTELQTEFLPEHKTKDKIDAARLAFVEAERKYEEHDAVDRLRSMVGKGQDKIALQASLDVLKSDYERVAAGMEPKTDPKKFVNHIGPEKIENETLDFEQLKHLGANIPIRDIIEPGSVDATLIDTEFDKVLEQLSDKKKTTDALKELMQKQYKVFMNEELKLDARSLNKIQDMQTTEFMSFYNNPETSPAQLREYKGVADTVNKFLETSSFSKQEIYKRDSIRKILLRIASGRAMKL